MQIYHNFIPTSTTLLLPGIPSYLQWAKTLLQHDRQMDYFRERICTPPLSPLFKVGGLVKFLTGRSYTGSTLHGGIGWGKFIFPFLSQKNVTYSSLLWFSGCLFYYSYSQTPLIQTLRGPEKVTD